MTDATLSFPTAFTAVYGELKQVTSAIRLGALKLKCASLQLVVSGALPQLML